MPNKTNVYVLERQTSDMVWHLVESSNNYVDLIKLGEDQLVARTSCLAVRILASNADLNPVWLQKKETFSPPKSLWDTPESLWEP